MSETKLVVDWGIACGRGYLSVNGIVVAMESDLCRDEKFGRYWQLEDFKAIVEGRLTR